MSVFWMGLTIFLVVLISFFAIFGIIKGMASLANAGKSSMHSAWVSPQVCSGDDSLGHPDLKKISELREDELAEEVENI